MTIQIERALQLVEVSPEALIVGDNVRTDARLEPSFVASIRERGVLEPIVAYPGTGETEGHLVVLYGQRRTLAAIEAGLVTVPVVTVLEPDEADRLVDQLGENDHRAPLAGNERIAAFKQLAAIGLSEFEMAKRTATPVEQVAAALEVSGSLAATAAVAELSAITLEQAAAIAEFDHDPGAVDRLKKNLVESPGWFDHELQRLRDDRDQAERHAAKLAELEEAGTVVVQDLAKAPRARRLGELLATKDGKPLTEAKHRRCAGAAVTLRETWVRNRREGWETVPVCADYLKHGHELIFGGRGVLPAAELTDEEREAEKARKREVIENNKAWAAAEVVRRAWLHTFVGRKKPPAGTAQFITVALTADSTLMDARLKNSNRYARDLLGAGAYAYGQPDQLAEIGAAAGTEARAIMVGLTVVLAAHEDRADREAWRTAQPSTARYLRFLEQHGYELSAVEVLACEKAE